MKKNGNSQKHGFPLEVVQVSKDESRGPSSMVKKYCTECLLKRYQ